MNKVAEFEKVSFERWGEDAANIYKDLLEKNKCDSIDYLLRTETNNMEAYYVNIQLPKRATRDSAGHDIAVPYPVTLKPNEALKIPTGLRCKINEGYVMMIYPRSSLGTKNQMFVSNTIPVVDSDYYYADNEGHIFIQIENRGHRELVLDSGDTFAQAVFVPFGVADTEEVRGVRTGGFGSTGR